MSTGTGSSGQPAPGTPVPVGRLGPWFAAIWLFFLVDPVLAGWQEADRVRGLLGILATAGFAGLYMVLWLRSRRQRHAMEMPQPTLREGLTWMVGLVVLGVAMLLLLGGPGIACVVYIAVAAVLVLPTAWGFAWVAAIGLGTLVLGSLTDWGSLGGLAFAVFAAGVAVWGLKQLMIRNVELVRAHERNAELAVETERTRFARDLHDILGHSLTVITVKAELANRLLEAGDEASRTRARAEVADLERLSRDALADVRRAVGGYRELSLSGELVRARDALASAEIRAELPGSTDEVPGTLQELFAWTIREGVTNVIRHSGASRCQVALGPTRVCIEDDGAGSDRPAGNGLTGLRERCVAAGAVLLTAPAQPRGFRLEVRLP